MRQPRPVQEFPFSSWPVRMPTDVPPNYVGPAIAAPQGPPPKPPARRGGVLGCMAAVFIPIALIGGGVMLSLPTQPPQHSDKLVTPPLPPRIWRCHEVGDQERANTLYRASRDWGSARKLRGSVAVVSLRVGGDKARWTPRMVADAILAGELASKFFVEHARVAGIDDLRVHYRPLGLESAVFLLPGLDVDAQRVMTPETAAALRRSVEDAIRSALAHTLDELFAEYRRKGFDEVAFLIELPIVSPPRSQAFRAWKDIDPERAAEIAFVLEAESDIGRHATIFAHEGLHLFGADDLYRVLPRDPLDAGDVMGDSCEHLLPANVGDTTAWAIGWRDEPPPRRYTIQ